MSRRRGFGRAENMFNYDYNLVDLIIIYYSISYYCYIIAIWKDENLLSMCFWNCGFEWFCMVLSSLN